MFNNTFYRKREIMVLRRDKIFILDSTGNILRQLGQVRSDNYNIPSLDSVASFWYPRAASMDAEGDVVVVDIHGAFKMSSTDGVVSMHFDRSFAVSTNSK